MGPNTEPCGTHLTTGSGFGFTIYITPFSVWFSSTICFFQVMLLHWNHPAVFHYFRVSSLCSPIVYDFDNQRICKVIVVLQWICSHLPDYLLEARLQIWLNFLVQTNVDLE